MNTMVYGCWWYIELVHEIYKPTCKLGGQLVPHNPGEIFNGSGKKVGIGRLSEKRKIAIGLSHVTIKVEVYPN